MQMAHAFDNRNWIPVRQQQQRFYPVDPLPPPSYDDAMFKTSSLDRPIHDSTHRHRHQSSATDEYYTCLADQSDTKPPSPARTPRMSSIVNNNYIRRSNVSSNGTKPNSTFLNTTQLYISQPSFNDCPPPPPPPPPRHPLQPPAIPPRNLATSQQKNSVTIPDFNSRLSPKTIYRSTTKSDEHHHSLEERLDNLSIDTNGPTSADYFGECQKCGETITSTDDPCEILGQIYHSSCAVCFLCRRSVKNKYFFIKDHLYCEEDFLYTGFYQSLEHCTACGHLITDTILQALGQSYHTTCFKCSKCSISLDGMPFIADKDQKLFCVPHYHLIHGPRCDKCSKPICPEKGSNETVRISSMGKNFHLQCYQCEDCSRQLGDEANQRCYPLDETLLCQECFLVRRREKENEQGNYQVIVYLCWLFHDDDRLMYSKFSDYFRPSRSTKHLSSVYNMENLTSEESDYYASAGGNNNDPLLRFIIIRHGERIDITYGPGWTQHAFSYTGQYHPFDGNMPPFIPSRANRFDYEVDTPLTLNGLKQSWTLGNTLARNNLPVVACYSSPAIRSIQTADQILNGMNRKAYIPIRLELGLFECSSWYAQSPISFMSDPELVNAGYNIDTSYRSKIKNLRTLETEYQYYDRSKETMKQLIKLHKKTGGTVLIVAHAPSLEVLTRHLMNGLPRPDQLGELCARVGYCSMTVVDGRPSSKLWQFRYSLDDQTNLQQQQLEQSTLFSNPSAIVPYQPVTNAFQFVTPQDAYHSSY